MGGPAATFTWSRPSKRLVNALPNSSIFRIWFPRRSNPVTLVVKAVPPETNFQDLVSTAVKLRYVGRQGSAARAVERTRGQKAHVIIRRLPETAVGEVLALGTVVRIVTPAVRCSIGAKLVKRVAGLRVERRGPATRFTSLAP